MNRAERRRRTATLTKARRQADHATRLAIADPDDHELVVKALALQATVKLLEALMGDDDRTDNDD